MFGAHRIERSIALTAMLLLAPSCRRWRARHARQATIGAQVFRATSVADLARGPSAAGRIGDVVLQNAHVRAVIDDVHQGGGFALSGGQLVDLTVRGGDDEIGQVFTTLGRFPRQLQYTTMALEHRADGTVAVTVTGDEPRTPGLVGSTTYSLGRDDRAVTITTTLHNRGHASTDVTLGDAIQWSGAEHWSPGIGFSLPRESDQPYIAGVGAGAAYAYVAQRAVHSTNGANWSDPAVAAVTLEPGASTSYTRRIGVSRGGDASGALAATGWDRRTGHVAVRIRAAETNAAIAGALVILHDANNAPVALASTDAEGLATLAIDPGSYTIEARVAGQLPDEASTGAMSTAVRVAGAETTTRDVSVGARSTLRMSVVEGAQPVPARILVYGVDGTRDPYLGAIGRADGARNSFVVSQREPSEIAIAPGTYRIVATHGPMDTLGEARIRIVAGERHVLVLDVQSAIERDGYLCGDFHTHQAPSLDAPLALRDRVRAAAAEGLDVIAATDHNVVTNLVPAIEAEGLRDRLFALVGDEVSTDAAMRPLGHWNLYPLVWHADQPRGGAPDLFDIDATQLIARVRAQAPDAVIQVNHPRSGIPTGLFDVVGFDRNTGLGANGLLPPTFDALEVWNGRYQPQSEGVMLDWLSLLRRGAHITAMGNSDSHSIVVQEVGYPRTCFRATGLTAATISADDVVRAIRVARDVVITDGPLITVKTADGASAIGRTVARDADGTASLHVHVESAAWFAVSSVEMVHSDSHVENVDITFDRDATRVRGDATVRVPPAEPFVLFRARGSVRNPVLTDDPPLVPMALTNPVYF